MQLMQWNVDLHQLISILYSQNMPFIWIMHSWLRRYLNYRQGVTRFWNWDHPWFATGNSCFFLLQNAYIKRLYEPPRLFYPHGLLWLDVLGCTRPIEKNAVYTRLCEFSSILFCVCPPTFFLHSFHRLTSDPNAVLFSLYTFFVLLESRQRCMFSWLLCDIFYRYIFKVVGCCNSVTIKCSNHFCSLCYDIPVSFGPSSQYVGNKEIFSIYIMDEKLDTWQIYGLSVDCWQYMSDEAGRRASGPKSQRKFLWSIKSCTGCDPHY